MTDRELIYESMKKLDKAFERYAAVQEAHIELTKRLYSLSELLKDYNYELQKLMRKENAYDASQEQ